MNQMETAGSVSVGWAVLSLEGEVSRGRRGSHAVATGVLAGGGAGSGRYAAHLLVATLCQADICCS